MALFGEHAGRLCDYVKQVGSRAAGPSHHERGQEPHLSRNSEMLRDREPFLRWTSDPIPN
jgi:hypothetical protein